MNASSRFKALALWASLSGLAPVALADVVTDWNVVAINATPGSTLPQTRTLAIMHAAVFDAVNSIERRFTSYAVDLTSSAGASPEAAAAAAAHGVLVKLVPAQQPSLDAALDAALAKLPDNQAKQDGIKVGKEAAEKMVELRRTDGHDAKIAYAPATSTGAWQPTPPGFLPAAAPQWGAQRPFVLKSAVHFTPKGMPAITSAEFARDINEVKTVGGARSTTRTADQTAVAIFWTTQPTVPWHAAARAAAETKGNSLIDNARLFALLSLSTADAYIASWAIKYRDNTLRPVTAIRTADKLGNGAVTPDPNWESLLVTPNHPDYVSGHCIFSGTAEQVLQMLFASDSVKVSVTYPQPFGVTRHYTSFSQMAKEVEDARVWGGIHTRTADAHATELGRRIGEYAVANILRPLPQRQAVPN